MPSIVFPFKFQNFQKNVTTNLVMYFCKYFLDLSYLTALKMNLLYKLKITN